MIGSRDERRRNFKKGIDSDMARRKREETTVELRKSKRDEQIQKRRMASRGTWNTEVQAVAQAPSQPMDPVVAQGLSQIPSLVVGVHSDDPNLQV